MKVRVTKKFLHRGQLIEPGTMLTIRDEDLPKVEHLVRPLSVDEMQQEYFTLLAHWWDDATEELPDAEVERMLSRLDTLYRELHRQGCRVPVRLPVEKNNSSAERRGEDHSTWTLSN